MSVSTTAHPDTQRATSARLWIAFFVIIAAGIGLAWLGAGSLRPEITRSGLEFRTVQQGTGEPITMNDVALIDYTGKLDDGTVFDSTAGGQPQPMSPQGMIPGFAEAMQKMREGGQYKLTIPPQLAYGDTPPPGLPAGSSLHFDVKVLKVARGAASMMQGMQNQPQQRGQ